MSEENQETPGATGRISAAVIVAHPDDETLWAGGTILEHRNWRWFAASLCRGSDPDRAPKFFHALQNLHASGAMDDLDDGPDQAPLEPETVRDAVASLVPARSYDIVITHSPYGEYTRHARHEETGRAVAALWKAGGIEAKSVWMFAYEDGGRKHLPRAIEDAHHRVKLTDEIWEEKRSIIEDVYGFSPYSFEARTSPDTEAFWQFDSPLEIEEWMSGREDMQR